MSDHSPGIAAASKALDDVLADRQRAENLLEQGWARTILIEPLTALAGGILGGTIVAVAAIAAGRRHLERRR